MTIAVDLGRKATKQAKTYRIFQYNVVSVANPDYSILLYNSNSLYKEFCLMTKVNIELRIKVEQLKR